MGCLVSFNSLDKVWLMFLHRTWWVGGRAIGRLTFPLVAS